MRAVSCFHALKLSIPRSLRLVGEPVLPQESGHEQLC
jgi:hypothetical protein